MEEVKSVIKRGRGRPLGSFKTDKLTDDKDYYNKRHHITNTPIRCCCGTVIRKKSMDKHLKSHIHSRGMELKENENDLAKN